MGVACVSRRTPASRNKDVELNGCDLAVHLRCITVQVGINNRDHLDQLGEDVNALITALRRLHVSSMYMGISVAPQMTRETQQAIAAINAPFGKCFGAYFIFPIKDANVDLLDPDLIHYTIGTQERILKAIIRRVDHMYTRFPPGGTR